MPSFVDSMILLCGALLVTGVLTTKFSSRFGMPALVLFIAIGMILSRFIYYDNAELTQLVGIFALIVILFQGGMQTDFKEIKPVYGDGHFTCNDRCLADNGCRRNIRCIHSGYFVTRGAVNWCDRWFDGRGGRLLGSRRNEFEETDSNDAGG